MTVRYLHLPAGSEPPVIGQDGPFKAVVVIEQETPQDWRDRIGDWLVRSGCLFMMAWGRDASAWHDSVDWALLTLHDFGDIPDDKHVLTTWHDDEPLAEVFWFSGYGAWHDAAPGMGVWIIDINPDDRQALMLEDYAAAQDAEPPA
ncbi:DUF7684 family protein [Brevundimonas sp. FT23028]|uniref:DUF7684 family protein n=1 Tax=Brevundimonas sp. FT23028 TaxID=3393748 RepID=UPI003B58A0E5